MRFDVLTIFGYAGAFACLIASLLLGHGDLNAILNAAGFLAAFGGSACAVITQTPLAELKRIPGMLRQILFERPTNPIEIIRTTTRFSEIARREGILSLERVTTELTDEFFAKALRLAIDGTSIDMINEIMSTELEYIERRHQEGKKIFDAMATYCPAFGMLGTIMHLCVVLLHLDDPKSIGPSMASALLTTFYGVLGCYAIFTPIAKKLDARSKTEVLKCEMIIRGVVAIQAGDTPRIVAEKLKVFLPKEEAALVGK